jgi:mycothiol synthase
MAAIRVLESGDAAALAALVERARAAGDLAGSSDPAAAFIVRLALGRPELIVVAEGDGGDLVGALFPDAKCLVVEPALRRRGIGRALVERALDLEREHGQPNLILGLLPDDEPGHAFLRATGFAYHSTVWDLELDRGVAVAAPSWPPGITARTIDRTRDIGPWVSLVNAAFAGHATPLQLDEDLIRATWDDGPGRDEDLLVLEVEDGRLVGYCAAEPRRLEDGAVEPEGEIWTIGVEPRRQGRGLGRQLLRWGVQRLRDVGVTTVTLAVNARNPRALALYLSEGFARTHARDRWVRRTGLEG